MIMIEILLENTSVNTKITIISVKKSLILIINIKKISPPAAITLPGDSLSGGQSPTARCAGAKLCRKNMKFYINTLPFSLILVPL